MKALFISLFVLHCQTAAQACSIVPPTPLQALQGLDMMFEGRVVAVYLNNTQVSSTLMHEYLQKAYGPVDITIKVAPSKYYFGTKAAVVELHARYDDSNNCADGIFFNPAGDLWGVTSHDGRNFTSNFHSHDAVMAKQLFEAAQQYQHQLEKHLDTTEAGSAILLADAAALQKLLDHDPSLQDTAFLAHPTELEKLPLEILKARLALLQELGFVGEQTRTKSAILMAQ